MASSTESGVPAQQTVELILGERPYLRRLAFSFTRNAADADDLVQETVLRALGARDRFQPGTCIRAWLSTILRRVYVSSVQTRARRATLPLTDAGFTGEDDFAASAPMGNVDGDPVTTTEAIEEHLDDRTRRALRRLPKLHLEPFRLFAFEELSYREIARRLGIPEGTVMSRIFRARMRLRCALAADGGDEAAAARRAQRPATRRATRVGSQATAVAAAS